MTILYNSDKMIELIRAWRDARCIDFGDCETRKLYESFKGWVFETRAMKRFPGLPVFGMAMRAAGYQKLVRHGRTHWVGISLPPE